jgi:pimeloyl-ACP methyl ester carboxylesterase
MHATAVHTRVLLQVAALAAAGYYVIVPDMPGYGQSDKPSNASAYSLKRVCSMLCGVLDAVGVQAACVVGHDWGAATAWALALQQPRRVSKLVVLSVGHPGVARGGGDWCIGCCEKLRQQTSALDSLRIVIRSMSIVVFRQ